MRTDEKPKAATKSGSTNGTYSVPALNKAVEILELMSMEPSGLSASDIVTRLGRSMGELYRIIVALNRLGLLARDEKRDRYYLSLKLFEMAHRHPPTARLVHAALPILDKLAYQSDQSAHLGAVEGDRLVILAQADSPRAMRYSVRVGAAFSTLDTSSGVVILAHSEARQRESYLAKLDPAECRRMEARFAEAVRLGYERHPSAVVTGVVNLSRPIFNHAGVPQGAITIPYLEQLHNKADLDSALDMVIAAADELSESLGWPGRTASRSSRSSQR